MATLPVQPYSVSSRIIHNQASCVAAGDLLQVTTPAEQWSYALEFPPLGDAAAVDKNMKLKLRAHVQEGVVGLGLLTPQRTGYQYEVQVVANEESQLVEIPIPEGAALGALMLRNTSARGYSRVDLDILGCEISPLSEDTTITGREPIVIDPEIFASFRPWSGWVPSGFFADWTGILTRVDVWAFNEKQLAVFNRYRHESHSVRLDWEHILDWAPLAQAVNEFIGTFRMVALGAGWGRWLAGGAALAAQTGRDYHLLGVEAEPQHFEWMLRHFKENKIPEDRYTVLNAAATGAPGECWFPVGNSQAWYGQAVYSEGQALAEAAELRRTKGMTIDEILNLLSPLDYLMMDIQGAELDVLSYSPDSLDQDVRLVNIGTHSLEVEALLRKLFRKLQWDCLYDVQLGSRHPIQLGDKVEPEVEFGDGVQVWRNPRLRAL